MKRFLLTVLAACAATNTLATNAETVAAAAEIADFDLPAGYRADFSAKVLGYTAASFRPDDTASHLYVIQSEKNADSEELAHMLQKLVPSSRDPQRRLTDTQTRSVSVRGQEGTLVISDGINAE
jgi:hypothetical protein